MKLIKKVFINDSKEKEYTEFRHADSIWILPSESIKEGLVMYQPSTIKGKFLKAAVRFGKNNKIGERINLRQTRMRLEEEILEQIEKITDMDRTEFEVAAYMGDSTSWQNEKVTLQIYDKEKIHCFLKITENENVSKNFDHEIKILKYLKGKKVPNVPSILLDEKKNGIHYFAQTTEKKFNDRVKLELSNKQLDFLWDINKKTEKELEFEESEFAYYVEYLKTKLENFSVEQKSIIERGIFLIEDKLKEEKYPYSFFHGDFTPWNVYFSNKEIQVFDFEYAHYSMPKYMDVFHYVTQASMLGKQAQIGGVIHEYRKHYRKISRYVQNPDFTYICYLIFIMSFYMIRTENATEQLKENYNIWIKVLEHLTNAKN